jgi:hypothetical protein
MKAVNGSVLPAEFLRSEAKVSIGAFLAFLFVPKELQVRVES